MLPRRISICSFAVLSMVLVGHDHGMQKQAAPHEKVSTPGTRTSGAVTPFTRMSLRFEPNAGQFDAEVRFVARRPGMTLFATDAGPTLALHAPRHTNASDEADESTGKDIVLRMGVAGGRKVSPVAERQLPGVTNYYLGADRSKWREGVAGFGRMTYRGVLDGVDLVFHGEDGQLEYDFVVAPNADSKAIALDVEGAREISLTAEGELSIHTERGDLVAPKPRVYQRDAEGREHDVVADYRLVGEHSVGFEVAAYDRGQELVIDPVLVYAGYVGGSNLDWMGSFGVDQDGNAIIAGTTSSTDFPLKTPFQPHYGGGTTDSFVTKVNPSGELVYSTYLGGGVPSPTGDPDFPSAAEQTTRLAVAPNGNAVIAGYTHAVDFPTSNAFQPSFGGQGQDAFVASLSPTGTLQFSSYLGGFGDEFLTGLALDANGNIVLSGNTIADDFPVHNAFQSTRGSPGTPFDDGFVAKVSADGALVYSSYLGGDSIDTPSSLAVDVSGNAVVVGTTLSTNFPTHAAFQPQTGSVGDVFVTKIGPDGAILYSSYLGGSLFDTNARVALDGANEAIIAFTTQSKDVPTLNAFQSTHGDGKYDVFVTKVSPAGTLMYASYIGEKTDGLAAALTTDADGKTVVGVAGDDYRDIVRITSAGGLVFRTRLYPQGSLAFAADAEGNTFVGGSVFQKVSPSGAILYSVYPQFAVDSVAIDGNGYLLLAGSSTFSGQLVPSITAPNAGPPHPTGQGDAFLAKYADIEPVPAPPSTDAASTTQDDAPATVAARASSAEDDAPTSAAGTRPTTPSVGESSGCRFAGRSSPPSSNAPAALLVALAALTARRVRRAPAKV
ncbi:Cell surface protein [Labilithrix luteola]|uniref:Cell surface protein n=1 Tax=Labilithrix luteola TaxID=1391654 RepID=A0A0K1Q9Y5_9BACT|nr:SBBP repeat-containing protein [Labilithrix luteola]AKV02606.1 Cell surface protein [Labilithrix luteola]